MNKSLAIAAFATSLSLAGAAFTAAGTTSTAAAAVASVGTPIKHVVVIYQENHSFDDTLGAYCAAATRTTPCNTQDRNGKVTGTPYVPGPVTFADGNVAPNITEPDMVPNIGHSPSVAVLAAQNKWDLIVGCKVAPYPCVTHTPPANAPNLTALADRYTVSDATFAAGGTVSFRAH